MLTGTCNACGRRFLDDSQMATLREKITDRRKLNHILRYCPECRHKGLGLVER